MRRSLLLLALFGGGCAPSLDSGVFPDRWIDGLSANEPAFQVHGYSPGVWILRQSLRSNFEAPFLFLIKGDRQALLLDSGATPTGSLRSVVDGLIGPETSLIVAHSHAHGDHVAGDGQFTGRPRTHIVGHSPTEVASFFGVDPWPTGVGSRDLGGRHLTILPIPGHEQASIAVYDSDTGLLLTGDSFYPGRLYVSDPAAYRASIDRLVNFTTARRVSWILGTHIEMTTTPGEDYPFEAPTHPSEHVLQLTPEHLLELQSSLRGMSGPVVRAVHDDFIVFPLS